MASSTEPKREGWGGGGRRHGPPTEEERRQHEAEFQQDFLNEYRKRYGDASISSDQVWELFQATEDQWHAKMKERHRRHSPNHGGPPPHHGGPPPHHGGPPPHFEEMRKRVLSELQQEFYNDFKTTYSANKINADQAWVLIQKLQKSKHEKFEADRRKHGHGPPPPHQ
ncbi:unnamed protein product [Adineta steineri]|uniref:Uncharacterized protein n=1 Tax=Adineta steineri TaxID=433720 RepID=A0A815LTI6_9BILA|nr:unnamed protein product [Adineta steineri]CAF1618626.1 unnamed protein product [Adineta steineri]